MGWSTQHLIPEGADDPVQGNVKSIRDGTLVRLEAKHDLSVRTRFATECGSLYEITAKRPLGDRFSYEIAEVLL